ncbi:MAG: carbon-nitrogen hydrolase family protein [Gammaproteobacteria bacterium]|nr:carbon-nitrogen hydrolase family protein [Gammaproteobacteria bacterium]
MTLTWQLTALQMTSAATPAENLMQIRSLLAQIPAARPQLVALPEGAMCFDGAVDANQLLQEPLGTGSWQQQLAALAAEFSIYLLVGTFPTKTADNEKFAASSLLFAPNGDLVADYQKIHLFDADVADGTGSYRESNRTAAGQKITVADLPGLKLGMAVCYDMRFPGLFQAMRNEGMTVLALPSAFTTVTGAAHWHTLLRARAIETQSFVLAPAQTGCHQQGRQTYGHSLIIDPWGTVLADAGEAPGIISVAVDLREVSALRAKMPVQRHNRFTSEFL